MRTERRFFLIGIVLFIGVFQNSCRSFHESKRDLPLDERIIYVFPDSVEIGVNEFFLQIHELRPNTDLNHFCGFLYKESVENYRLVIFDYKNEETPKDDKVVMRVNSSNRYFVVNNRFIPLLFESDFDFGTVSPISNMGEMGNRYTKVLRFNLILEDNRLPNFHFNKEKLINKY